MPHLRRDEQSGIFVLDDYVDADGAALVLDVLASVGDIADGDLDELDESF